jgi:hypothetical protein
VEVVELNLEQVLVLEELVVEELVEIQQQQDQQILVVEVVELTMVLEELVEPEVQELSLCVYQDQHVQQ